MTERSDDQEQFERLYRATYPAVTAYCRRRISASEVDDAVTDIYLVAWQKRDKFFTAEWPLAWLYAIGFRIVSQRHRTNKYRRLLHGRLEREQHLQTETPETVFVINEEAASAFAVLEGLGTKDRELLYLWVFEDLSYDEIASMSGSSRASVRSSIYRVRQRLRELRDRQERGER